MKRIVVPADIHGHLPALDAVLAEPDVAAADLTVLAGELVDGPFPSETLDRLEALGSRALRGNGDRWLHSGTSRSAARLSETVGVTAKV